MITRDEMKSAVHNTISLLSGIDLSPDSEVMGPSPVECCDFNTVVDTLLDQLNMTIKDRERQVTG